MKRTFKKIASVLFAFAMLMSLSPAGVMATDTITVYVTVSNQGVPAEDKNGMPVAYRQMEVTDMDDDNKITVSDAMIATHEAYSANGKADYALNYGYANKLWGVSSTNLLAFVNNAGFSTSWDNKTIGDGDHIVASVNTDHETYADWYTYFDVPVKKILVGTEFTLTLKGFQGMAGGTAEAVSGVKIGIWSDGAFSAIDGKTTNENGEVSLSFDTSGTYYVTANGTVSDEVTTNWSTGETAQKDCPIIAPICVVTVSEEKTDAEYVAEDKEALSVMYTPGQNLMLPNTGKSGKTNITWNSGSTIIDALTGDVTLPDADTTVTLIATITYGDAEDTRDFSVHIPGRLHTAKDILQAAILKPVEYTNATEYGYKYDSIPDDTNILTLASAAIHDDNVTVTFAEDFTATDCIASDGTITYPKDEAKEITLPLILTSNEQSEEATVRAEIPKHAQTKKEAIDAMKQAMAGYMRDSKVLGDNTSLSEVKTTLLLPGGKTSGLYITWTSTDENVIKVTGNPSSSSSHPSGGKYEVEINRPNIGQADAVITLTATFVYKDTSIMCGAGPMPEEEARQIAYTVTVPAVTDAEIQGVLNGAASDIKITDKNGESVDLANIKDNLYFPSYEGYTTTWTTDLPITIPEKGYGKSIVTRPVPGDNTEGTITLTLTKGETSKSKSFDATVLAWTEGELEAERAKLQKIADALTFDEIKNKNTDAEAVTSNLNLRQNAKIDGDKVTFNTYNSGSYPYQITWTITPTDIIVFSNGTGKVTAPLHTTEISLDAEVSLKISITGVESAKKTIKVTVPGTRDANTAESLEALLNGIAAQTTTTTNWESFLAMAAYEKARPSGSALTNAAKQNMINSVLRGITAENPDEVTYSKAILDMHSIGINPKEMYPVNGNKPVDAVAGLNRSSHASAIWTAVYTLLAYQQGDYSIGTQEADVVSALLETQLGNGGWTSWETAEADATGMAILALAAYYHENANVKTAVDKAILYLSEVQLDNGGFGGTWGENANNSACVIMGLCAVGIHPDKDVRFIKNGNSVLDRLLDFSLENNTGFGLAVGDTAVNAYATQQGFPALIAAYQVIKNDTAFNVYDFSSNTLSPGRATGTGTVITPSAPSGDSITVRVTIKSDTGYWLKNKSVTVSGSGATVCHALIEALKNSGIAQVGAANGYVESMTKGGRTLAEFGNGKNAGWMYKVNGDLPKVGLTEYAIDDGDEIVWFYTNDWTSVPGAKGSVGGKGASLIQDAGEDSANTPSTETCPFGDASNHWAYEAIRYVYENSLMQGTDEATFAPDENMTRAMLVTVLYRMANPESTEKTHAFTDVPEGQWYSDAVAWAASNGIVNGITSTAFAPDNDISREQMALIIYRFAKVQGYDVTDRADVSNFADADDVSDWALDAMQWANKTELLNGTSETTLSPKDTTTRAQVAAILMRFCETLVK